MIILPPYKNNDELWAYLGTLGYVGSIDDRVFSYLRANGYTGGLADMVYAFNLAGGVAPELDFLMTVRTTGASETFTIPCSNDGTFNATIDWGDGGAASEITTFNDADLAHVYADAGDYQIRVSGAFPNIAFDNGGDRLKLISVDNLGSVGWVTFADAFYGCSNMLTFTVGDADVSGVGISLQMFRNCSGLTTLDLSGLNSQFGNMSSMFFGCSGLTSIDLTGFDTSTCSTFNAMFRNCSSLASIDVSSFDTSSVSDMAAMFVGCSSLTDVPGIEDWDITGLNSTGDLTSFMTNSTLNRARYDALLINWAAQDPFNSMTPNFGSSQYTGGGAAEAGRDKLIATDLWTITDGGVFF